MSHITNFEDIQKMDSTDTIYHSVVSDMEPGVVYTIDPGKGYTNRMNRTTMRLNRQLKMSMACNIIIGILFLAVCVFSFIKFNELNESFEKLSKQYNEIIIARTNAVSAKTIVYDKLESYYAHPIEINVDEYSSEEINVEDDDESDEGVLFIDESLISEEINLEQDSNVEEEEVEEEEVVVPEMFDFIPLDGNLKEYIYTSAINANIPAEVIFSLAWKESIYDADASSGTNDHGLFQINECNFDKLSKIYGYTYSEFCKKIYDPYLNTDCAILILTECRDKYNNDNWHHVLMRYNMGPSGTNELFKKGIYSSKYTRALLAYAKDNFNFTDIELH